MILSPQEFLASTAKHNIGPNLFHAVLAGVLTDDTVSKLTDTHMDQAYFIHNVEQATVTFTSMSTQDAIDSMYPHAKAFELLRHISF